MPVVSAFNSAKYEESIENVLKEFLLDYFPTSSHIITFQPPAVPDKPTIWLHMLPGQNREKRTADGKGKWVQGKQITYLISVLSRTRADAITAADRMTGAVLASSSILGGAGLRYAELMPFEDSIVDTQSEQYRRSSALMFTVEIRA